MKIFKDVLNEIKRYLYSKNIRIIMFLTIISPILGYNIYQPATNSTTASIYLGNPTLAGGLVGTFIFSIYALYEWNIEKKNNIKIITDTIVNPIYKSIIKIISIIVIVFITVSISALVFVPYTIYKLNAQFNLLEYTQSFYILMFPSIIIGILLIISLYQIYNRVDLSIISFLIMVFFCISPFTYNEYLLRWINPLIPVFSSNFGNIFYFKTALYSRILWICISIGLYILSLLSIRVYEKNFIGSIGRNIKKIMIPIFGIGCILLSIALYLNEPFIDNGEIAVMDNIVSSGGMAISVSDDEEDKNNKNLILKYREFDVALDTKKGRINGVANYKIENKSNSSEELLFDISPGYKVEKILVNNSEIDFTDLNQAYDYGSRDIVVKLPEGNSYKIEIQYGGKIKIPFESRGMLLSGEITDEYIYIGGNRLYPKLAIEKVEDIPIKGNIRVSNKINLVSTGSIPKIIEEHSDGTNTWKVQTNGDKMTVFGGDYKYMELKDTSFPVRFYYGAKHESEFKNWDIESMLNEVMDYCTSLYGELPYTENHPLNLVMISAHFQGGGANENLSFMSEAFFTKEFLKDPLKGANALEVIAHEIIHQWWGVQRFMYDMENFDWSSEGITVYTSYRMMKDKYGEEYAKKNYIDIWKEEYVKTNNNFYLRNPGYMEKLPEMYLFNLQSQLISSNQYVKIPIQLLKAEKLLGGEDEMDRVLKKLFENGGVEMPPYITWQDFLDESGLVEEDLIIREEDLDV